MRSRTLNTSLAMMCILLAGCAAPAAEITTDGSAEPSERPDDEDTEARLAIEIVTSAVEVPRPAGRFTSADIGFDGSQVLFSTGEPFAVFSYDVATHQVTQIHDAGGGLSLPTRPSEFVGLSAWNSGSAEVVFLGSAPTAETLLSPAVEMSECDVSADGRYAVFDARPIENLDSEEKRVDVYLADRSDATMRPISTTSYDGVDIRFARSPRLSADGRYVVFYAASHDPSQPFHLQYPLIGLLRYDVQKGKLDKLLPEAAQPVAISGDGNRVLVHHTAVGLWDLDRDTFTPLDFGGFELRSTTGDLSDDGVWAVVTAEFDPETGEAFAPGPHGVRPAGVFLVNLDTSNVWRVDVSPEGEPANALAQNPRISGDGRHVVFFSQATNLGVVSESGLYTAKVSSVSD